jgi:hypothetical protein
MNEASETQQTIPISTGEDAHVTGARHNARTKAHPIADNASEGMTLREYFAAAALQGLLSDRGAVDQREVAMAAYEAVMCADALLLALEQTPFGVSMEPVAK